VGPAGVHTVRIDLANTDLADRLGGSLTAWLAITPDHCFLLAGGDPRGRLARMLEETAKAPREVRAGIVIQVDVDQAVALAGLLQPDAAAPPAADGGPGTLQLAIRPVDRGIAWRLSVDAAAIRSAVGVAGRLGLPAGVPQGLPFGGDLP
jgi:hypothetical protein